MRHSKRIFFQGLIVVGGLLASTGPVGAGGLGAFQEADYLLNLPHYVQWPPQDSQGNTATPIVIGVLGSPSLRTVLQGKLTGEKRFQGRLLQARSLAPSQTNSLRKCNILFIPAAEKDEIPGVLQALRGASVLTVSDTDGFGSMGGMLEMGEENKNLRWKVNLHEVNKEGIFLSSQLLRLAQVEQPVW